ncbi:MAG: hypothetical protein HC933_03325 [Pleurocapsa sp. SU_196_0]|nr:hypothetical protein [Pleurocapsa sp. SU_196_0]
MSVALHLRAPITAVARTLEPLLLPDSSAVLIPHGDWVSVHAEQLSEDLADITELAAPLSEAFGLVWAATTLHHRFEHGTHLETTHTPPTDVPLEVTLDEDAVLPDNAVRVTRDADKPGLAEFFGRSRDE